MTSELLECVEVGPGREPVASILWLHGLGADGHDFQQIVPELRMPETMPIRYVFPHAPMRPVPHPRSIVASQRSQWMGRESRELDAQAGIPASGQIGRVPEHGVYPLGVRGVVGGSSRRGDEAVGEVVRILHGEARRANG